MYAPALNFRGLDLNNLLSSDPHCTILPPHVLSSDSHPFPGRGRMFIVHVPHTYRCRLDRGNGSRLTFMAAVAVAPESPTATQSNDRGRNRGNGGGRGADLTF